MSFFSLLLKELTGTYLSSMAVSNLSNLLSGFRQEAVGLSHIFSSLNLDLLFLLSSKMSLSLGTLKGVELLIGGNWVMNGLPLSLLGGCSWEEISISYINTIIFENSFFSRSDFQCYKY